MMLSIDTWWKKREMWKRILKARGIEIDSSDELDRFITNMDMLLHAQQYADASEGFHSAKMPTIEELLAIIQDVRGEK